MIHIILYEPEIPHNTGAIGRLCVATKARLHLIKPLGFSLDEKAVRRAGLDYWQEVDLHLWDDWEDFSTHNSQLPLFFYTTKTDNEHWNQQYPSNCGLIFGPESRGLPESLIKKHSKSAIKIPMKTGPIRSLNLATAVGIGLFEALRPQS